MSPPGWMSAFADAEGSEGAREPGSQGAREAGASPFTVGDFRSRKNLSDPSSVSRRATAIFAVGPGWSRPRFDIQRTGGFQSEAGHCAACQDDFDAGQHVLRLPIDPLLSEAFAAVWRNPPTGPGGWPLPLPLQGGLECQLRAPEFAAHLPGSPDGLDGDMRVLQRGLLLSGYLHLLPAGIIPLRVLLVADPQGGLGTGWLRIGNVDGTILRSDASPRERFRGFPRSPSDWRVRVVLLR